MERRDDNKEQNSSIGYERAERTREKKTWTEYEKADPERCERQRPRERDGKRK